MTQHRQNPYHQGLLPFEYSCVGLFWVRAQSQPRGRAGGRANGLSTQAVVASSIHAYYIDSAAHLWYADNVYREMQRE